jgi:hypothetical protein
MSLFKSDDFIADVEQQFEWYVVHAGWEVADRYVIAVQATCRLLEQHPQLGPGSGFKQPAGCSNNTLSLVRAAASSIHSCAVGDSLWCFTRSTNTSYSTKPPATV